MIYNLIMPRSLSVEKGFGINVSILNQLDFFQVYSWYLLYFLLEFTVLKVVILLDLKHA